MSKGSCEAAGSAEGATLRMARAERPPRVSKENGEKNERTGINCIQRIRRRRPAV